jgi:hypothetical protein
MAMKIRDKEQAVKLTTTYLPPGDDPWLPQVGEPVLHYYRFKFYLDLGPARKLDTVSKELEVPMQRIRDLAKQFNWEARCLAYDRHIVDVEFRARDSATEVDAVEWSSRRSRIRERAYQLGTQIMEKAEEMLAFPLEQTTETVHEEVDADGVHIVHQRVVMPTKWALRDVAAFAKTADDMVRLAAEMPTSHQKVTIESKKVDLAIKMVVNLMAQGQERDQVRQNLLGVGIEQDIIDIAFTKIEETA